MQQVLRSLLLFSAVACPFALLAYGQEAESVGDIARQARQQKQNKDGKSKAATTSTTPKIITNDEIPEHSEAAEEPTGSEGEGHAGTSSASASDGAKMSAEQWKSQIRAQKDLVPSLQSGIEKLNDSIQFAPATASPAVYSGTNARSKSSKK
jgi:Ni/Co efflux regulator RcnB